MIRTTLSIVAAAVLIPAAAAAQDPCSLLTPDQIKAVLNSPVEPGQPGVAKDSNECTWSDAQGEDRVYIALRPAAEFRTFRTQIDKSGAHPAPVTGVGDDAFFVAPDESSSALYVLTKAISCSSPSPSPTPPSRPPRPPKSPSPPKSSPNSDPGNCTTLGRVAHSSGAPFISKRDEWDTALP
jgi:hypothetical protein